jgi:exosortase E/protease (VPEID-CTERM system)
MTSARGLSSRKVISAERASTVAPSTVPGNVDREGNVDAAYLLPLLAVLTVSLVTGLSTTGFDFLYPLRVFAAIAVLWKYREHYPRLRLESPWFALGAGLLVAFVWIVGFEHSGTETLSDTGRTLASLPPFGAALWLVFRVMGGVLTVPLIEELAFRGYLMRRVASRVFEKLTYRGAGWLGLVVSSLAFGALHSQFALGTLAGGVFGLLAMARGRLSDAILAHAAANLALAAYAIATGDWALLG